MHITPQQDAKARDIFGSIARDKYVQPEMEYRNITADANYVSTLPDLQNGPSSLIKGSAVKIQQVGIHNFRLPLRYMCKDGGELTLETSVTGTVSLEGVKKGINMSRIMRTFYEHEAELFSIDLLDTVLTAYMSKLESLDASIILGISYPIRQESLRSGLSGYQYYNISLEARAHNGKLAKFIHFDFVYSSACPCSNELAEHARAFRGVAAIPHSQRSVARVSVQFEDLIWFEDLRDLCAAALHTETQVMVKREDEQAFAELNGAHPKFVEDAVRQLYEALDSDARIVDFRVVASHNESLHSHNAISVVVKGVDNGFTDHVSRDEIQALGLR